MSDNRSDFIVHYAFPSSVTNGLTKRELFAAMCLQGLAGDATTIDAEIIARTSVACADALLAELEK